MGDPRGSSAIFTYTYDRNSRLSTTTYPGGEIVTTGYDDAGQPKTLGNGTDQYVKNAWYDLYGRPTLIHYGNDVKDTRAYHGANHRHRIASLKTSLGTGLHLWSEFQDYNGRGQLEQLTDFRNGFGTLSNTGGFVYDFLGRLINFNASDVARTRVYDYDPMGNIRQQNDLFLDYDDPNKPHQLTEIHQGSPTGPVTPVSHDPNGSRVSKGSGGSGSTYMYNLEGRVKEITANAPTVQFTYDAGGQKTTEMVPGLPAVWTRYYTPLITSTSNNETIKTYFFGGLRVATRVTDDMSWQTAALNDLGFARLASVPLSEPALSLQIKPGYGLPLVVIIGSITLALGVLPLRTRRRACGLRIRHGHVIGTSLLWIAISLPWPIVLTPGTAEALTKALRYYHYDHLGSTQVVTEGLNIASKGQPVEQIRYHPYGEIRGRWDGSGIAIIGFGTRPRYEFTGYETQANSSGLEYANARFYDPALGTFLSHDPAAEFVNPYNYTAWDPANLTDPTGADLGLTPFLIAFAIGFAVSAINAAANGASLEQALKAGAIGGAISAVSYGYLGPVASEIADAGFQSAVAAVRLAAAGYGVYGVAEGFRTGQYFAAAAGAVLLAYGLYRAAPTFGARASKASSGTGGGGFQERGLSESETLEYKQLYGNRSVPANFWENVTLDNSSGLGDRPYAWRWPWSDTVRIHLGSGYSKDPLVGNTIEAATLAHELAHAIDFRQSWLGTALGAARDQIAYSFGADVYNPSLRSAESLSGFSVEGRATLHEWDYRLSYGMSGGGSHFPTTPADIRRLYDILHE